MNNIELNVAILEEANIEVWLEDVTGAHQLDGNGVIEEYTDEEVKVRMSDGSLMRYKRNLVQIRSNRAAG